MRLTCICCGKLWDVEYVLRQKPEDFTRQGAIIRACPRCHGTEPDGMTEKERIRLRAVAAIGEHLGHELDRLAASNDDLRGLKFCFDGDLSKLGNKIERLADNFAHLKGLKRRSMSKQRWNPRFTLYARSNGLSERQQIKKDREAWPGGCMAGFSIWITRKWSDWWKQHRGDREYLPKSVSNAILGDEEHKLFDEWLCENYRPKE